MQNLGNKTLREFLEERLKIRAFQIEPSAAYGFDQSLKEDFILKTENLFPTKLVWDLIVEYHSLLDVPFVKELTPGKEVEGHLYFNKPDSLVVVNPIFDARRATISVFEFKGIRY